VSWFSVQTALTSLAKEELIYDGSFGIEANDRSKAYRLNMGIAVFALLEKFTYKANVSMGDLRSKNAAVRRNARMKVSAEMGSNIPTALKTHILGNQRSRPAYIRLVHKCIADGMNVPENTRLLRAMLRNAQNTGALQYVEHSNSGSPHAVRKYRHRCLPPGVSNSTQISNNTMKKT
jgi:hypothetical protein